MLYLKTLAAVAAADATNREQQSGCP